MNNKINGCVHRFDAEAGVLLPISKKKHNFHVYLNMCGKNKIERAIATHDVQ
jgi:hypothetical protein